MVMFPNHHRRPFHFHLMQDKVDEDFKKCRGRCRASFLDLSGSMLHIFSATLPTLTLFFHIDDYSFYHNNLIFICMYASCHRELVSAGKRGPRSDASAGFHALNLMGKSWISYTCNALLQFKQYTRRALHLPTLDCNLDTWGLLRCHLREQESMTSA
ncbi:hypothetical protein Pfo_021288, partial [Paulownia fortunei]